MLPCASVSEALCCVNRQQLGLVSAIKGYLKAATHPLLAACFTCWSSASLSCINTSTVCRETSQEAVKMSLLICPFLHSPGCVPSGLTTLLVTPFYWTCLISVMVYSWSAEMCLLLAAGSFSVLKITKNKKNNNNNKTKCTVFLNKQFFRHKSHSEMLLSFTPSFRSSLFKNSTNYKMKPLFFN